MSETLYTTLVECENCGAHQLDGRVCECGGRPIDWADRRQRVLAWSATICNLPRHRWPSYVYEEDDAL
jgi:ribosomal protein L32